MEYLVAQAESEEKPVEEAVAVVEQPEEPVEAKGLLDNIDGGLVGIIVMVAICLNIALGAASKILEKFKDMTETKVDNTIYKWVNMISKFLHKLVDFVGMNPEHKSKK